MFLMVRLGVLILGWKPREERVHIHQIVSRVHEINMTHDCRGQLNPLAKIVLVRFRH